MFRSQIIIAALLSFASTGEAFTVTGRPCPLPSSTCLRAEEEEAAPAAEEQVEEAASEDSATDILNSPAFLERKLDVLNSDIAKVEEDMEAAKEQLSAGKAEWGDQLEDLDKEVSVSVKASWVALFKCWFAKALAWLLIVFGIYLFAHKCFFLV